MALSQKATDVIAALDRGEQVSPDLKLVQARLLGELAARIAAGGGGGGSSTKLVTVADDAAFAALTSAQVKVGDFVYIAFSASNPDISDSVLQLVSAGQEGLVSGYALLAPVSIWLADFYAATTKAAAAAALVNGNPIAPSSIGATTLTGNLSFTDATYDIGASNANRPRHANFSGNLFANNGVTSVLLGCGTYGNNTVLFYSPSNGKLRLTNGNQSDFTALQFGALNTTRPALYVASANLECKLADGSAYTGFNAKDLCAIGGIIKLASFTVATLPSASTSGAGAQTYVTDSNQTLAAGIGTTAAGGGANKHRVTSDGSNWIVG